MNSYSILLLYDIQKCAKIKTQRERDTFENKNI